MKLFCSYAFTGEVLETVGKRMGSLNKAGHVAYCPLFDPVTIRL